MKIRNGFVSNSSSSSFVIIGYKADKMFTDLDKINVIKRLNPALLENEEIKKRDIKEIWYEFMYNTDFGLKGVKYLSDDGPGYFGVVLIEVSSEDNDVENSVSTIEETMNKVKQLQDLFSITEPPKIYVGTRST